MTVGYPDFQDYANCTGQPIANQVAFSLSNATPFSANGFISNYASARIRVAPQGSAQGCTVTVTYYTDSTQTVVTGTYQWIIAAPSALSVIVPNLGPFVAISVTTTTVAAFNCAISLTPIVAACASPRYTAVGNQLKFVNQSVAASGSVSALMPFTAEGPGYWFAFPRDASAKLNLQVWVVGQNGGQAQKVDEVDGLAVSFVRAVYGDQQTLGLFVTNTDGAAAHSFDARLVIDGR